MCFPMGRQKKVAYVARMALSVTGEAKAALCLGPSGAGGSAWEHGEGPQDIVAGVILPGEEKLRL